MINFSCVACGHLLQIQDYFAGCSVQCPSCKAQVKTPESQGNQTHIAISDSASPTRPLPRPPALPPTLPPTMLLEPQSREEPMVAIPGLLEGASAAQAVPVSLPPSLESSQASAQTSAATLQPPKPDSLPAWMEPPSWMDEPQRNGLPQPPPLPPDVRAEAEAFHLPTQPETSGKAMGSVILGMGTFLVPVLCAIPAFVLGMLALADIRRKRGRLEGRGLAYTGLVLAILGNVSLIPAFLIKANFDQARTERRIKNNLEVIAKALLKYELERGQLPLAGIKNDKGETTLSWRVAILPYLGHDAFFKEFKTDEPWDSDHNRKLLSRMPAVFGSSNVYGADPPHTTHIQVITGLNTFFPEGAPRSTNVEFADSKFLVVEARDAVLWTKPDDIVYRRDKDETPRLGASTKDGFYAGMADGTGRFIDGKADRFTLQSAIDPSDRNPVFREKMGKGKGMIVPDPFDRPPPWKDGLPMEFKDAAPKMAPPFPDWKPGDERLKW